MYEAFNRGDSRPPGCRDGDADRAGSSARHGRRDRRARGGGRRQPAARRRAAACGGDGRDRARLAADPDGEVDPGARRAFGAMVRRRLRREPVAYILGRRGFRRIELAVDPRVLIPRPETELLVEVALELEPRSVLDVGTGSGAVALAVADELPGVTRDGHGHLADALGVARGERRAPRPRRTGGASPRLGPAGRTLRPRARQPALRARGRVGRSLAPEITEYEPREALVAGPTGSKRSTRSLGGSLPSADGAIALEVGAGQAADVAELVRRAGFERRRDAPRPRRDRAGGRREAVRREPDRVVIADAGRRGPGGARALRPGRRRRALPRRHPLRARLRPARRAARSSASTRSRGATRASRRR